MLSRFDFLKNLDDLPTRVDQKSGAQDAHILAPHKLLQGPHTIGFANLMFGKIAVRCGYQLNQEIASWSAGIGLCSDIGKHMFEFNYAYSNVDVFTNVNRFSVGIAF